MKHLKNKKIFESKYDRRKESQDDILDTIRDILLEANDIDIKTNVYKKQLYKNRAVINMSVIGWMRFSDIEDVIDRILEYLKMNSCIDVSMLMDEHSISLTFFGAYKEKYVPITMKSCTIFFTLPSGL